jgi:hypothetical protein
MAHSMGGLVVRYALNTNTKLRTNTVKLITLGTPHLGTPFANPTWVHETLDQPGIDALIATLHAIKFEGNKGDFDLAWHAPEEHPPIIQDDLVDLAELLAAFARYDDLLIYNSLSELVQIQHN